MRLFDLEKVGIFLDDIGHRVERDDDCEVKMIDLTLRVQPLTPELAAALDPDVRALLFSMTTGEPKPKIKTLEFKLTIEPQRALVYLLPEAPAPQLLIDDMEITSVRARTEKGVDGFGLVFYASFGPVSRDELEYFVNWHTQQRFLTFEPFAPGLLDAVEQTQGAAPGSGQGEEIRPGVLAEH